MKFNLFIFCATSILSLCFTSPLITEPEVRHFIQEQAEALGTSELAAWWGGFAVITGLFIVIIKWLLGRFSRSLDEISESVKSVDKHITELLNKMK